MNIPHHINTGVHTNTRIIIGEHKHARIDIQGWAGRGGRSRIIIGGGGSGWGQFFCGYTTFCLKGLRLLLSLVYLVCISLCMGSEASCGGNLLLTFSTFT